MSVFSFYAFLLMSVSIVHVHSYIVSVMCSVVQAFNYTA